MEGYFNLTEFCKKNNIRPCHMINYKVIKKELLITRIGRGGSTYYPEEFKKSLEEYVLNKKKPPSKYCVYFLHDGTYTKIGISNNVKKRLQMLQIGNPNKINIIAHSKILDNAQSIERALHKKYKKYKTVGEWFLLSPSEEQNLQQFLLGL